VRAISPTSDAATGDGAKDGVRNGATHSHGHALSAFELFVSDNKSALLAEHKDDSDGGEEWAETELEKRWDDLNRKEREEYEERSAKTQDSLDERKSASRAKVSRGKPAQDEDVEMQTYDSDQETQGDKADD
jgi:hypothetical protein